MKLKLVPSPLKPKNTPRAFPSHPVFGPPGILAPVGVEADGPLPEDLTAPRLSPSGRGGWRFREQPVFCSPPSKKHKRAIYQYPQTNPNQSGPMSIHQPNRKPLKAKLHGRQRKPLERDAASCPDVLNQNHDQRGYCSPIVTSDYE